MAAPAVTAKAMAMTATWHGQCHAHVMALATAWACPGILSMIRDGNGMAPAHDQEHGIAIAERS
jgi:hypothetical protein